MSNLTNATLSRYFYKLISGNRCPHRHNGSIFMKQSGQLSPTLIIGIAGVLTVVGALGYAKVQTARLEAANARIEAYKQAGEIAERLAKQKDAENKAKKEKADADYKRNIAALQRDNKRLRNSANSSSLPGTSATTGQPDRITFDRAELDAAIRSFTAGTAAIATEGAEAVNALDNAKAWAKEK